MASYDPYDAPPRERTTRRYYREERRDDRDPRYYEARETLHVQPSRDLVPRPREDSDLSVEEIRRDFPPPGYSSRDLHRARSAEPGHYDDYDDRRSHYSRDRAYDDYDRDRKPHKKSEVAYYEEERKTRGRVLSKQEQIIAAVTGAALAIGGKELYDRREANQHGTDVHRNLLASAALGAAGAFAGYQGTEFYNKRKEKDEKKVLAHRSGYYSDDEESAKEKKGHKNFLESALAAAGLGGAVKALTGGGGKDDKSDTRSRRGSRSRSRSRSTSRSRGKDKDGHAKGGAANKVQKAAMASLIAGATEAFRISKQPGSWKGEKAKRVLTAAAGAATLDAAQSDEKAGSKLGIAEAVVGGLLGNRVINGSKKNIEMDEKTGRSRSRSRARAKDGGGGGGVSGLAALATAGLGAFGAKKLMDNHERSRSRRRSVDSRDSRDGSPDRRHRSRSRSIVDGARRRLAKVGIGNGPDDDDRDHHRDRSRDRRRDYDDYEDSGRSRRHRDDYDDHDRDRSRDRRRGGGRDDYDDGRSHRGGGGGGGGRDRDRSRQGRRGSVSSSDLGDSDEDRKRDKKMRGKQIITTGLAAVATIHAAHSVYLSMEKRHARKKAVREGRISHEQAEKMKNRALLQDAAAVGIAALGIKGAISEVKEAREIRHEMREWRQEKEERHRRRLERQKRLANGGGSGGGSDKAGGRRADDWSSAAPPGAGRYDEGPRYADGNPYAAMLPAGPPDRR